MNFPSLSVVIPVKDEKENLPTLLAEIFAVLEPLAESYEVIVVDDGSIDGTLALLENMAQCTPVLRYLSFDRNYGRRLLF